MALDRPRPNTRATDPVPRHYAGYESPDDEHPPPALSARRPVKLAGPSSPDLEDGMPPNRHVCNPSSLNGMMTKAEISMSYRKIGLRDRIACYQWTWFTMNMVRVSSPC